ncbi:MAG: bifunctional homocysteine S-methyltransferase/methylenetetrahydrofolate reductase [Fimbriimonadaceae bacterium]
MSFAKLVTSGVIILGDGANGTCLAAGSFLRRPYDLACLEAPQLVLATHRAYFAAGADFVETNTFEANALRLGEHAGVMAELNIAGARLAREAASEFAGKFVLGAIGPCGKPVEPIGAVRLADVRCAAAEQALALIEGGVDGFMLETFIDVGELAATVEGVRSVSDLPIIASKAYVEDGEALAEGLPLQCARQMSSLAVQAVGANCVVGPQRMLDLVRMISEATNLPIIAFPTPGVPQLVKGQLVYDASAEYFARAAGRLIEAGATIIGGCCGTTPDHIRALRELIDSGALKVKPHAAVVREARARPQLESTPPSRFGEKLARGEFVTAVEMDVPRGLKLDRLLKGAEELKGCGVDVINISDGARARLRMTPTAVVCLLRSQVGMEATMHFSCRDRNLLAIQADLLGAHALGIRNVLAVTGDPANVGDYPSATSVFDVDAIGLVRILARFNEGIDLAGYSIGVKCGFTIAVAFNPLAVDADTELDRLRRKVEAGATVVYTQPVFDRETADIAIRACAALDVPCLMGVLPLRNPRHAEFMHNEVPGVRIPAWLRERIAGATDDASALEIGVEEAAKLAGYLRTVAQGLYLMPPFGNPTIARRVIEESIV